MSLYVAMKRIEYLVLVSRLRTAFMFCILCCVGDALSEKLQCNKRHIINTLDMDELYTQNACVYESEGQNLTSADCTLWNFADGRYDYDDCKNLAFATRSRDYLSGVQLHPHTSRGIAYLNITFRNIKWHYVQLRQQTDGAQLCHKLQLLGAVQPQLRLSLSCDVGAARGERVQLLLDAGDGGASRPTARARLLLRVPENAAAAEESDITNWVIMVVVDVAHKPNLVVHWPAVPDKFGVTRYNVQVEDSEAKEVDVSSCPDGYCSLELFAGYASRRVNVFVQPVHEDCAGALCRSYSPDFVLEFSLPLYFALLMVLAAVLFFTMIICCIYFSCCCVRKDPHMLLILYDATELQHCRVVRKLAEYLKEVANIQCCIADADVPLTDSQNPSTWLREKFGECSAVLVVASPAMHPDKRYSIYPNVLNEALPLIESHRGCPKHATSCGRYLVAVPSYCTAADIPQGLEDLPRVRLPQQLGFLVWSVYNQHCWWPLLVCMVKIYLLSCWCPGPMSAYKKYGDQLAEAIRVAEATQTVVETAPLTPRSSKYTQWTLMNPKKYEIDNESMPYKEYPGNLNDYSLLGGSIISEEIAAPKGAHSIDHLSL